MFKIANSNPQALFTYIWLSQTYPIFDLIFFKTRWLIRVESKLVGFFNLNMRPLPEIGEP